MESCCWGRMAEWGLVISRRPWRLDENSCSWLLPAEGGLSPIFASKGGSQQPPSRLVHLAKHCQPVPSLDLEIRRGLLDNFEDGRRRSAKAQNTQTVRVKRLAQSTTPTRVCPFA